MPPEGQKGNSKMEAIKKQFMFKHDMDYVVKALKKHFDVRSLRVGKLKDGRLELVSSGEKIYICGDDLANIFGGVGGYYKGAEYIEPHVEWDVDSSNKPKELHIWKDILTWDELCSAFRKHNVGFGKVGNPEVWSAVVVYSRRMSNWKRMYWECDFKDKAYRLHSNAEIFLEEDPSAGLIRHPYCPMKTLGGADTLIRQPHGWVEEYCYIEG